MNVNHSVELNMDEKSRTEYSARNTTVAMLARVIAILMGFVTRVVFTHTLSEDYVGINGLFTDILNVLALSELGIGTAITYALYKPIAEKDIEKQKSLMLLYKRFYRLVAGIVLLAGLLVIPFMDILIKNQPKVDHLILLYVMYLANSVISYLFVYKRTLVDAYQLSYIGVLCQTIFLVLQNIIQIIVLFTTRNFILFVAVLLLCTLGNNLSISMKADRMYPFLKDKNVQTLPKEEKHGIYQNIKAMLMHKVGNVVVTNTDNLLLSALVGIVSVGIYSNYFLVIGSVRQVLNQAFQGITASVGNLGVEESKERVKRIFDAAFFIGQWLFGFAAICLYELLTPFVELSFGSQYVFSIEITLVLCLNFYLTGMRQATLVFRDSLGLFWFDRYKSLIEAIINLVVSMIMGYFWGTIGIFIGTLVSTVSTSLWVEPYMLYKHRLQAPVRFYFIKYVWYVIVTAVAWIFTDFLCGFVSGGSLRQCLLRFALCLVIPNVLFLLLHGRSREFVFLCKKVRSMLMTWKEKKNKTQEGLASPFTQEEQQFLLLVKESIGPQSIKEENIDVDDTMWESIITMAENHSVLSLMYNRLENEKHLPNALWKKTEDTAKQTVLQQYHLLFLSKYLIKTLEENQIQTVLLKGVGVGAYYPVPELRKSGDVDLLLLEPSKEDALREILLDRGFWVKEEQLALHHITFESRSGIEIEVHTLLAEPFDNRKMNQYLEELLHSGKCVAADKDVMGLKLAVLPKAYFAFELLLHMLQHFLRSGFGLKLLCDWVMFWQVEVEQKDKDQYMELVTQAGIKDFSDVVTQACVSYLGLDANAIIWMNCSKNCPVEEFMKEILEAEEFGKSHEHRMVMLRGTKLWDYVREFHHQMQLNYSKAGKCILLWPILWVCTLIRFIDNNRKFRKVSTGAILKEAGRRSRLMEKLQLFD